MVLIVTNRQDLTSDFVVRELSRRGVPFSRLNTDEFPTLAVGTASYTGNETPRLTLRWTNRDRILDLSGVTSILYRRPVPPEPDPRITDRWVRRFCVDESYEFLRGMWLSLDCYWMSHPEAIRIAEHKLVQLRIASSLPLSVPRTLVTNDPLEVDGFFRVCPHGIVVKPLYMGFIDGATPRTIFTSIVREEDLKDLELVRLAPSIFQERVLKRCDIRVTVVGRKVFAVEINAPSVLEGIPDWRHAPPKELEYKEHNLPAEVENACLELVSRLNLQFGAIDLAVDENGGYVFFEINPNGQWAWLEVALGLPISEAIVGRLLARCEES